MVDDFYKDLFEREQQMRYMFETLYLQQVQETKNAHRGIRRLRNKLLYLKLANRYEIEEYQAK